MVSPSRKSALHCVGISLSAVSESWVGKDSSCFDGVIRAYVTVYNAQNTLFEQMRIDLAIAVGISYKSNSLLVHHIFLKYAFVRDNLEFDSWSRWVDGFWMGSFRGVDVVPLQGRRFLPFHVCLPRWLWINNCRSFGEMKNGKHSIFLFSSIFISICFLSFLSFLSSLLFHSISPSPISFTPFSTIQCNDSH